MSVFASLADGFSRAALWPEAGVLLACLLLAWALAHQLAARHRAAGDANLCVWRGSHGWDGALFPLLAWLLASAGAAALHSLAVPLFWLPLARALLLALAVIRFVARVLRRAWPQSGGVRRLERSISWLVWALAALHIAGVLPEITRGLQDIHVPVGKQSLTLLHLVQALLVAALALVSVLWLSSLLEQRLLGAWIDDLSLRSMAVRIARSLLIFLAMLLVLSVLGVDLTALSVMGGALGVGLGFGMQKIAANYVSGFIVLMERAVRIGDAVRIGGFEGRIRAIRTRFTVVRAANGREAIVPNEALITQTVENLSQMEELAPAPEETPATTALCSSIIVAVDSDMAQVERILLAAASAQGPVAPQPAPDVLLTDFTPRGLHMCLRYHIDPAAQAHTDAQAVRSQVNLAALHGLRAAGIRLAALQSP